MTPFTTNLKRLRKEKGATQDDLAQRLHVTRQTVSGWETGRCQPDIETLMALAEALDADVNELIYGTKPGEYPKFQRKYVIWTAVCGAIAAAAVIYWIWILPVFKRYCSITYLPYASGTMFMVPQISWFAAGAFLPAALSLVYPVRMTDRKQLLCRIVGLILALPAALILVDCVLTIFISGYPQVFTRLFLDFLLWESGRTILLCILPLFAGILIFLGVNRE